jgi:cell division protein FtsB
MDNKDLRQSEVQTQKNLTAETKIAEELKRRLNKLNTNAYVEELARTRLGMIKQGETAYKIIKK